MSTALQSGVELGSPFLLCAGVLTALILYGNHSYSEFMNAIVQSCPEDIALLTALRSLSLAIFLLPLPQWSLNLVCGGEMDVPFVS